MDHFNRADNRRNNGGNRPRQRESIAEKAEKYVAPIKAMLSLESAGTQEIKTGVTTISRMMEANKNVTAHQVRNIFSLVNDIDPENADGQSLKILNMLRPRLAYIGARQTNDDGKIVVYVLDQLITSFSDETNAKTVKEKIKGLRYIMESIVAYHKYYSKN